VLPAILTPARREPRQLALPDLRSAAPRAEAAARLLGLLVTGSRARMRRARSRSRRSAGRLPDSCSGCPSSGSKSSSQTVRATVLPKTASARQGLTRSSASGFPPLRESADHRLHQRRRVQAKGAPRRFAASRFGRHVRGVGEVRRAAARPTRRSRSKRFPPPHPFRPPDASQETVSQRDPASPVTS